MNTAITAIILFIAYITGQPTKNHRRIARIANGDQFPKGHYTYVVRLNIKHLNEHGIIKRIYCTGSLVSPLFVLSAAHCISERLIRMEVIIKI